MPKPKRGPNTDELLYLFSRQCHLVRLSSSYQKFNKAFGFETSFGQEFHIDRESFYSFVVLMRPLFDSGETVNINTVSSAVRMALRNDPNENLLVNFQEKVGKSFKQNKARTEIIDGTNLVWNITMPVFADISSNIQLLEKVMYGEIFHVDITEALDMDTLDRETHDHLFKALTFYLLDIFAIATQLEQIILAGWALGSLPVHSLTHGRIEIPKARIENGKILPVSGARPLVDSEWFK